MKIIELDQKSPEWMKWRGEGIGSSDIATIMGVNPYQTPKQLWEEKCGIREPFSGNRFTTHGVLNEPLVREWLNKNLSLQLDTFCLEDDENPIFKASLDGYDRKIKRLYEIKCPYTLDKISKIRTENKIPIMWKLQILWAAALVGAHTAFLAVWDFTTSECFCMECVRDPELEKEMFHEAQKFWDNVKRFTSPPLMKGDYIEVEDEELHSLLLEYNVQDVLCKEATSKKNLLKEKIVEFGDDGNFAAYGYKICRMTPRKTYNMEQMVKDGIDLEKYVKPSHSLGHYTIRVPKN